MCYAAADVNLDGRVDASDESAWLALLQMGGMNPVTGEPDRRMDLNGDGEVTEADFALWGPLFEQACKRPNEVGAMVDDGPFNGVAEGGVLTVPTRRGTWNGGTWVMHTPRGGQPLRVRGVSVGPVLAVVPRAAPGL
jgi:hypothetical protein